MDLIKLNIKERLYVGGRSYEFMVNKFINIHDLISHVHQLVKYPFGIRLGFENKNYIFSDCSQNLNYYIKYEYDEAKCSSFDLTWMPKLRGGCTTHDLYAQFVPPNTDFDINSLNKHNYSEKFFIKSGSGYCCDRTLQSFIQIPQSVQFVFSVSKLSYAPFSHLSMNKHNIQLSKCQIWDFENIESKNPFLNLWDKNSNGRLVEEELNPKLHENLISIIASYFEDKVETEFHMTENETDWIVVLKPRFILTRLAVYRFQFNGPDPVSNLFFIN